MRAALMKRGSPQTPFNGGFRVLITGAHGFQRTVTFAIADDPAVIGTACGRRWRGRGATFGSQPSNVRLRCMAVQLHTYCQGKQKCGPTDYFLCLRAARRASRSTMTACWRDTAPVGHRKVAAYCSAEAPVAFRVFTKRSWRSPMTPVSPFANSAVTLSREMRRSSYPFLAFASGV